LDILSLAYTGMILCRLASQDISEGDKSTRVCEYKCTDGRKNEIVNTGAEFQCPRNLYVEKVKNDG